MAHRREADPLLTVVRPPTVIIIIICSTGVVCRVYGMVDDDDDEDESQITRARLSNSTRSVFEHGVCVRTECPGDGY